jgi:hypothetical protein
MSVWPSLVVGKEVVIVVLHSLALAPIARALSFGG